jgi:hypothetical protein
VTAHSIVIGLLLTFPWALVGIVTLGTAVTAMGRWLACFQRPYQASMVGRSIRPQSGDRRRKVQMRSGSASALGSASPAFSLRRIPRPRPTCALSPCVSPISRLRQQSERQERPRHPYPAWSCHLPSLHSGSPATGCHSYGCWPLPNARDAGLPRQPRRAIPRGPLLRCDALLVSLPCELFQNLRSPPAWKRRPSCCWRRAGDRSAARLSSRLAHHDPFWDTLFQPGMFHGGVSELVVTRRPPPMPDAIGG